MEEPKGLNEARDALAKQLDNHVGSAYGLIDTLIDKNMVWHLIVWSNDENIQFPSIFKGFKVARYDVPVPLAIEYEITKDF